MKITYHYANGKSFTTPYARHLYLNRNSIVTHHDVNKDYHKLPKPDDRTIDKSITGVTRIFTNPLHFFEDPEMIASVNLGEVSVDRIDIKLYQVRIYELLLDQAVNAGWRVNMRKMHNRETGYNIHITLTKPTL